MARLLLGKEVNEKLNARIISDCEALKAKGVVPTLAIIRCGERPDDLSYERGATKRADTLGVAVEKIVLPEDVTKEKLIETIDAVNANDKIHGVLLFRPLPKHLKADQDEISNRVDPKKDIDGMTDLSNAGVFMGKELGFAPCTPEACMEILAHYGIDCTGKKAVVIGRSLVVGKPAAVYKKAPCFHKRKHTGKRHFNVIKQFELAAVGKRFFNSVTASSKFCCV